MGGVTKVVGKGMFGKSGKIETRLLYVKMSDDKLCIRGAVGDRGKGGTAATVGTVLLLWPAAFFVTGTSALMPPGTGAIGHVEADMPVVFAADAERPLVAPAVIGPDVSPAPSMQAPEGSTPAGLIPVAATTGAATNP